MEAIVFIHDGEPFPVPPAQAIRLAEQLELREAPVTEPAGALAFLIREALASDSASAWQVSLKGYELTEFVNAISEVMGAGERLPHLERLRRAILGA